jgi:hypothetical protein
MEKPEAMTCCEAAIGTDKQESGATFEYVGEFGLTVVGDATHRPYIFRETGARVAVDRRDVFCLLSIPILRRVR